ncbi:aldo-keto reductase-like protein [Aulographum hederae CBS 113979]|uniref:Aldo-keto reductase-like protein n=1 Tax=Aulographum hederae CBS 113979 TaxID=1176131 RepID=A0A6G1HA46_9PEZI|nr:aldo-keto reductase-like protein [Aulographum hederae CBS 113979]
MATTPLTLRQPFTFIYGTAWKKSSTKRLVKEAISAGFVAVDTAAQPKRYREELVGEALREVYSESGGRVGREDVFLQTKFTSPQGQDQSNMPYLASSPLQTQLHNSLASSFHNLRPLASPSSSNETYIDCLLLHSPLQTPSATLSAWKVLESYVPTRIRTLGISNVSLPILKEVYDHASTKPAVVQNRFYAATGYDVPLRAFCREKGIVYESFWTLTGNPGIVGGKVVGELAEKVGVEREVAMYGLVMGLGVAVLNGTTNSERMRGDLEGVGKVEEWAGRNGGEWEKILGGFKETIGNMEAQEEITH